MGITWGVWITPAAQARASKVCTAFGVGLAVVGLAALYGATTVDVEHAREVEKRMYEYGVASGQVKPDEHKLYHPPHDSEHAATTETRTSTTPAITPTMAPETTPELPTTETSPETGGIEVDESPAENAAEETEETPADAATTPPSETPAESPAVDAAADNPPTSEIDPIEEE
jgi:hypothetical protein